MVDGHPVGLRASDRPKDQGHGRGESAVLGLPGRHAPDGWQGAGRVRGALRYALGHADRFESVHGHVRNARSITSGTHPLTQGRPAMTRPQADAFVLRPLAAVLRRPKVGFAPRGRVILFSHFANSVLTRDSASFGV
jgi:hypothetical protein